MIVGVAGVRDESGILTVREGLGGESERGRECFSVMVL